MITGISVGIAPTRGAATFGTKMSVPQAARSFAASSTRETYTLASLIMIMFAVA